MPRSSQPNGQSSNAAGTSPRTPNEPKASPTQPSESDLDAIHDALSAERRRHALRALVQNGTLSKRDLARYVAAHEYGKPLDDVTSQERKRVTVSLHQFHLDNLEGYGFVVWNEDTNQVALGENADLVLPHLHGVESEKQSITDRVASFF